MITKPGVRPLTDNFFRTLGSVCLLSSHHSLGKAGPSSSLRNRDWKQYNRTEPQDLLLQQRKWWKSWAWVTEELARDQGCHMIRNRESGACVSDGSGGGCSPQSSNVCDSLGGAESLPDKGKVEASSTRWHKITFWEARGSVSRARRQFSHFPGSQDSPDFSGETGAIVTRCQSPHCSLLSSQVFTAENNTVRSCMLPPVLISCASLLATHTVTV